MAAWRPDDDYTPQPLQSLDWVVMVVIAVLSPVWVEGLWRIVS